MQMKTLHPAYRISDLGSSLAFYADVGFQEIARVNLPDRTLVMLNLPGDGDVVTLELVYEPSIAKLQVGNGFSHLAIQVDDLDAVLRGLTEAGIYFSGPELPGGPDGPKTAFITDPDGYRLELVQWPPGHGDGITRADFA